MPLVLNHNLKLLIFPILTITINFWFAVAFLITFLSRKLHEYE